MLTLICCATFVASAFGANLNNEGLQPLLPNIHRHVLPRKLLRKESFEETSGESFEESEFEAEDDDQLDVVRVDGNADSFGSTVSLGSVSDNDQDQQVRADLEGSKLGTLTKKAIEELVNKVDIERALNNADKPRQAMLELIVNNRRAQASPKHTSKDSAGAEFAEGEVGAITSNEWQQIEMKERSGRCLSWCSEYSGDDSRRRRRRRKTYTWDEICSWTDCSDCNPCPAPTPAPPTPVGPTPVPSSANCQGWCSTYVGSLSLVRLESSRRRRRKYTWDEVCSWTECSDCGQCPASTPLPPTAAPCESWCASYWNSGRRRRKTTLEEVCDWAECSGCSQCPDPTPQPPPEAPPNVYLKIGVGYCKQYKEISDDTLPDTDPYTECMSRCYEEYQQDPNSYSATTFYTRTEYGQQKCACCGPGTSPDMQSMESESGYTFFEMTYLGSSCTFDDGKRAGPLDEDECKDENILVDNEQKALTCGGNCSCCGNESIIIESTLLMPVVGLYCHAKDACKDKELKINGDKHVLLSCSTGQDACTGMTITTTNGKCTCSAGNCNSFCNDPLPTALTDYGDYVMTPADVSECPDGVYPIESAKACEELTWSLGFQFMGAGVFYMHPRGCNIDPDYMVTFNWITPVDPPGGMASPNSMLLCAKSETCATFKCPQHHKHNLNSDRLPNPNVGKCCEPEMAAGSCMANNLCMAELGNKADDNEYMCECIYNTQGRMNSAKCKDWLLCLHNKADEHRTWFKELLQLAVSPKLGDFGMSLVQPLNASTVGSRRRGRKDLHLTALGAGHCDSGLPVTNAADCSSFAAELGYTYGEAENANDRPPGCYRTLDGNVTFNADATGVPFENTSLLCQDFPNCIDPAKEDLFALDCDCVDDLHKRCAGAMDRQECVKDHACAMQGVCGSWKAGRCYPVLSSSSSLIENPLPPKRNQIDEMQGSLVDRSERAAVKAYSTSLDEATTRKCR